MSDKRKRLRCKNCKQRVNVIYKKEGKNIRFTCPKCFCNGEFINKEI